MKPGTIITDVEGLDLGPEGAVVVQLDGDEVELARLDTKEFITVQLDALDDYHAEEAPEGTGFTQWGFDEDAMESPDLHTIRNLPDWWGPRDPNSPSSLTDVSYRPEPTWRRQQHRHYSTEDRGTQEDIRMTYRPRRHRRTADPIPWMDPVPRSTVPQQQLQRDYGLPRRMELHRWEESKDDAFDTEVLVAHTVDFWKQYREQRYGIHYAAGSTRNLSLDAWGRRYMHRAGLQRSEMDLLYRFMVATTLIPTAEYHRFQDLLDLQPMIQYVHEAG